MEAGRTFSRRSRGRGGRRSARVTRLLLRLDRRRCVEDRPMAAPTGTTSPTASSSAPRSAPSRLRRRIPNVDLRRHGRELHPRQRIARRRRVSLHRRRPAPGRTWACETRGTSPRCASTPANPDLVYVAALGHAHGPNQERGVFRSQRRREVVGARPVPQSRMPAPATSAWIRTIRVSCTPPSGKRAEPPGA